MPRKGKKAGKPKSKGRAKVNRLRKENKKLRKQVAKTFQISTVIKEWCPVVIPVADFLLELFKD
jgi:hypothetical protein